MTVGLYLCIFAGDDELDGVEVGRYADFAAFRDMVCEVLEAGVAGARFPVLMNHSDCDGEWGPDEAAALLRELQTIQAECVQRPPVPLPVGWKQEVARTFGLRPANLHECFFDVDGESLIDRLAGLCRCATQRRLPILFQ